MNNTLAPITFTDVCKENLLVSPCISFIAAKLFTTITILVYFTIKASQLVLLYQHNPQSKRQQIHINPNPIYFECFTSLNIIIYSIYNSIPVTTYSECVLLLVFNSTILILMQVRSDEHKYDKIQYFLRILLIGCLYTLYLRRITQSTSSYLIHVSTVVNVLLFGYELLSFFQNVQENNYQAAISTDQQQAQQQQSGSKTTTTSFLSILLQLVLIIFRSYGLYIEYPYETTLQSHYIFRFLCVFLLGLQVFTMKLISFKRLQKPTQIDPQTPSTTPTTPTTTTTPTIPTTNDTNNNEIDGNNEQASRLDSILALEQSTGSEVKTVTTKKSRKI